MPPPNPDAVADLEASVARGKERRAAERPARLTVLATGPVLRDVEAAADCWCACHPRVADVTLHGGGATCACQLTDAEHEAALKRFVWPEPSPEARERLEHNAEAFDQTAEALGVTVDQWGGFAPFQISGSVAGRAFYLRCRHEAWTVTVAPDDDPLGDPLDHSRVTFEVASGDENDLCPDGPLDPALALRIAVWAVEDFLLRRVCAHTMPDVDGARFCTFCGVRLDDVDRWRV